MAVIYGVDTGKEVTPLMIRDALLKCFISAHCQQTGLEEGADESSSKSYCELIVKNAFKETNGDFENPSKESISAVLPWLADFAKSFRDQSLIQTHMGEIQKLLALLK